MSAVIIKRITREHLPFTMMEEGTSIGDMVEKMLFTAAKEGQEVQSIELAIDEMEWQKYLRWVHEGRNGAPGGAPVANNRKVAK